ncbi:RNA 2',3'-cyclic phosphodiesterase [Virgibacillus necropolis]|uniref:RNA 2',3'-cyclic phosphodiesterase n=1 Tax=Virgibacillus necropolis TaxID=163877 RepID=UPI00384ED5CC
MTVNPHYFIAIPIPSGVKELVMEWQSDLKSSLSYKQWTNKEDLHITLKFLGAVHKNVLEKLVAELQTLENLSPLSLDLKGIKTFGNPSSPRVIYANVQQSESLNQLVEIVESCAELCDFAKETRDFRAHITLAKKWNGQSLKEPVETITGKYSNENHTFKMGQVHLYQVHPNENPKYEVIESFTLKER